MRREHDSERCEECGAYIDGLTTDAVRHPIFMTLCVRCGDAEGWWADEQSRREAAGEEDESWRAEGPR